MNNFHLRAKHSGDPGPELGKVDIYWHPGERNSHGGMQKLTRDGSDEFGLQYAYKTDIDKNHKIEQESSTDRDQDS